MFLFPFHVVSVKSKRNLIALNVKFRANVHAKSFDILQSCNLGVPFGKLIICISRPFAISGLSWRFLGRFVPTNASVSNIKLVIEYPQLSSRESLKYVW